MACGDKYKHLAITVSGYTFEKPRGWYPIASYYEEWYQLTEELVAKATSKLKQLATIECKATGGGANCTVYSLPGDIAPADPKLVAYNGLRPLYNQMQQEFAELYDTWNVGVLGHDLDAAIAEAQAVIATALCLMEESDKGIQLYGGTPTPTPGGQRAPDDGSLWWLWAGGGIVLTVGVVALGKRWARGRRERSAPPANRRAAPRPAMTGNERLAEEALVASR